MENASESSNLPSNPSVESENVQEEMRSDKKKKTEGCVKLLGPFHKDKCWWCSEGKM